MDCLDSLQIKPGLKVQFHPDCYWQRDSHGATAYEIVAINYSVRSRSYAISGTALDGVKSGRCYCGWSIDHAGYANDGKGKGTPLFVALTSDTLPASVAKYCTCDRPEPKPGGSIITPWTLCSKCLLEIK